MQAERIRAATVDVAGLELVCVSRDGGGDWRRVLVPAGGYRGAHMAVTRGGDWQVLPAPALSVYVDPQWVPAAWRRKHPQSDRWMKLVVEAEHTESGVLERLLAQGRKRWHTLEHVEQRRDRRAAKRERGES